MAEAALAPPAGAVPDEAPAVARRAGAGRRLLAHKGGVVGLAILLAWIVEAVLAEVIAPYDPTLTVGLARRPPGAEFWLGTDHLGRDLLSRILHGTRISLSLGLISVALGAVPGITLGLLAGYHGGWTDTAISRFIDALLALPSILLALLVIASLGPSIQNVMIAVGVATVPAYARLTRGSVLAIKALPYVEAARVAGAKAPRIMLRHILVNANAPLVVLSTLQVGNAILIGSGLSFLGLGAQPPTPEWGLMSAEGREVLRKAWWISTFPGVAILTVVVACNLLGDGLRSALDPKMRLE